MHQLPQTERCILGESPHWDVKSQTLYWVDIFGKKIYLYSELSNSTKVYPVPEMVGHVIPKSEQEVMITMPSGIYILNLDTNKFNKITNLEPNLPNNRPNDGKCDPQGRLWVGTIDMEFKPGASSLYRLDNNKLTKVLSDLTLANGMAWDTANNLFYFIDSDKACIQKFNYNPKTGDINNPELAFKFPKELGLPDGMCIDNKGMLWVAGFDGGCIYKFNPHTQKLLKTVQLPTKYPTSCVIGGKNLNKIFVTSSSHLITGNEVPEDKTSGFTYVISF